jgi:hypothetical protein
MMGCKSEEARRLEYTLRPLVELPDMLYRKAYQECNRTMATESMITCPACGASQVETMPTDACQFFYECARCGKTLRPKPGDCCVFCSYGSIPCPSRQDSN